MRIHFLNHRQISLALRHLPIKIAHRQFAQLERGLSTLEGVNDSFLGFVARMRQCLEDHRNTPREREPR